MFDLKSGSALLIFRPTHPIPLKFVHSCFILGMHVPCDLDHVIKFLSFRPSVSDSIFPVVPDLMPPSLQLLLRPVLLIEGCEARLQANLDCLQTMANELPTNFDQPRLHLNQAIRSVNLCLDELRLAKLVAFIHFLQRLKVFITKYRKMPAVEDSESSEP